MVVAQRTDDERRRHMIADAAYYRAERRGFAGGDPVADWLEAEAEIDASLGGSAPGRSVGTLDERLETADERLAAWRARLADASSGVRREWQHDLEKLAGLRDSFKTRLDEAREHGARVGDEAQWRAEKIWEEISELLHRLASRRTDSDDRNSE